MPYGPATSIASVQIPQSSMPVNSAFGHCPRQYVRVCWSPVFSNTGLGRCASMHGYNHRVVWAAPAGTGVYLHKAVNVALQSSPQGRLNQEGVWLRQHSQSTVQGVTFTGEIFLFGYSCLLANTSKGFFSSFYPLVQGEQEHAIALSQHGGCLTCLSGKLPPENMCLLEIEFTMWLWTCLLLDSLFQ